MQTCTRALGFDAGHRLLKHESKCASLHGHRYTAEVTCASETLDSVGRVIDFSKIKEVVGGWIDKHWDHAMILNAEDPALKADPEFFGPKVPFPFEGNPTAENLAKYLFAQANELLFPFGIQCTHIKLWETPNCWVEYSE